MTALNPVHTIGAPGRRAAAAAPRPVRRRRAQGGARAARPRRHPGRGARASTPIRTSSPAASASASRIAMALACGPDLLIADEPTTALDVTIQKQILDLIREPGRRARHGADPDLARPRRDRAERVERMLVMYGGSVVESGPTAAVFADRAHPYTQGLFAARPGAAARRAARGWRPSRAACPNWWTCRRAARSPAAAASRSTPATSTRRRRSQLAARPPGALHPARRRSPPTQERPHDRPLRSGSAVAPRCSKSTDLVRHYTLPREKLFGAAAAWCKALNGVSFTHPGRAAAWASSANRARASRPRAAGDGARPADLRQRAAAGPRPARAAARASCARRGATSRWCSRTPTARSIRARPWRASSPSRWRRWPRPAAPSSASAPARRSPPSACAPPTCDKYPHEFSGGQRQRIAIARALDHAAAPDRGRRAGERARRLGAGAGAQPDAGPAAAVRHQLPADQPRPRGGATTCATRSACCTAGWWSSAARRSSCSRTPSIRTRRRCWRRCRAPSRAAARMSKCLPRVRPLAMM